MWLVMSIALRITSERGVPHAASSPHPNSRRVPAGPRRRHCRAEPNRFPLVVSGFDGHLLVGRERAVVNMERNND